MNVQGIFLSITVSMVMTVTIMSLLLIMGAERKFNIGWFVIIFLVCLLGSLPFLAVVPEPYEISRISPIYSAEFTDTIQGRFVLGGGYITTEPYYAYYTGGQFSGYLLEKVPAEASRIFMDEENAPYIIEMHMHNELTGSNYDYHYEIHVPKGTIVPRYDLNVRSRE